jgi:DNA-binding transcriptional ArsR family regulator
MITIDSDPTLNPIYIGASILNNLSSFEYSEIEIEKLYESVKVEFGASYDVFVYTLDWLYIAGAIQLNEKGNIEYATE